VRRPNDIYRAHAICRQRVASGDGPGGLIVGCSALALVCESGNLASTVRGHLTGSNKPFVVPVIACGDEGKLACYERRVKRSCFASLKESRADVGFVGVSNKQADPIRPAIL